MGNKFLFYGLSASLVVHLAVISVASFTRLQVLDRVSQDVKVIYRPEKNKESSAIRKQPEPLKSSVKRFSKPLDVFAKQFDLSPTKSKEIKDMSQLTGRLNFEKSRNSPTKATDWEHRISVPLLTSEKITNPQYLSYNDTIRTRIRQHAYIYADHPDFQTGQVYLTFVLSSQGVLQQIKIKEEKTLANNYLRDISLRSVREASPFPPFPKGFDYPEFTFNVLIAFQE